LLGGVVTTFFHVCCVVVLFAFWVVTCFYLFLFIYLFICLFMYYHCYYAWMSAVFPERLLV